MKAEFVIQKIETQLHSDIITLKLQKYVPPPKLEPKPEPQPPQPDPLETFKPESKGEKLLLEFCRGLRKLGYDPFPPPTPRPLFVRARAYPVIESTLALSKKEYVQLGKPGLGQKIEVTIEKKEKEE